MIHAVTLSDFARRLTESRNLASDYAATLRRRAAAFEQHAGETVLGLVLSEIRLNAFLASLGHLSPYTVRGYRTDLLTLWYAAADEDLVAYPMARRIKRKKLPDLLIDCYTVEEAQALLDYARKFPGVYPNGVKKSAYWSAAIPLAWDAGIRRGDVWRFRRDSVRPDNSLKIIQGKTQHVVQVMLRQATIAALDAIGRRQPCAWMMCEERFNKHFKLIVKRSGVNRGVFKWFRRASGSYVEAQQPGAGHKHLGHKHATTFDRFYDAKLGGHALPQPPALT